MPALHKVLILCCLATAAGCAADNPDWRAPEPADPYAGPTGEAVLRLVNHPSTTFSLLDSRVGLDRRAATRIIGLRNGPDGLAGTADDQPFASVEALDAVPFVGDKALERLATYAHAHGWVVDDAAAYGRFLGVDFTAAQARRALDLLNRAEPDTLEYQIGLPGPLVETLLDVRPFASLHELLLLQPLDAAHFKALRGA